LQEKSWEGDKSKVVDHEGVGLTGKGGIQEVADTC